MSQAQLSHPATPDLSGYAGNSAKNLSTLVYRSRAVEPLSVAELHQLTMGAQDRNARELITGVLVYDDSRFFQWLEGPVESLDRVVLSIRSDRRHTDFVILDEKSSPKRVFGTWSMKLATAVAKTTPWSGEILDPPAAVLKQLRTRPNEAPGALIQLYPNANADAARPPALNSVPLGKSASDILGSVILTTVLPHMAGRRRGRESEPSPVVAHPRASELAELLVAPDENAARNLIKELHTARGSIWPLYATLFEPAARGLGNLWAEDQCTEFDVTLGLCRLQSVVRLLSAGAPPQYPHATPNVAVLIAPVPGEIHRLGAALDSEVLWNYGWAPRCEFPSDDKTLLELVSDTWFDVLDISLSTSFQRRHLLPRLSKTIASARRASKNPALVVVVGGRVFVEERSSLEEVGADLASLTSSGVDQLIRQGLADRAGNMELERPKSNCQAI